MYIKVLHWEVTGEAQTSSKKGKERILIIQRMMHRYYSKKSIEGIEILRTIARVAHKTSLIYRKFLWYFAHSKIIRKLAELFGFNNQVCIRKGIHWYVFLKIGVPKIWKHIGVYDDNNIHNFQWIIRFFTIPHKVVFKDFASFLETSELRNNSFLVRTIFAAWTTCQRLLI